ncbi:MAG: hypothetical protein RLZ75_2587, partial [Pseudomonadota bacterium]
MELLNLTKQAILAPAGLQEHHIEKIFNQLLSSPVELADL